MNAKKFIEVIILNGPNIWENKKEYFD